MASASDILTVRANTDEREEQTSTYDDTLIGTLIDASGVTGASAIIWEQKAASLSDAINVSEAGASHSFGDLFKNAQAMAKFWGDKKAVEVRAASTGRVRVKVINRQ